MLEVNPRASRTVPFVGKATGVPLAKVGRALHGRARASREAGARGDAAARAHLGEGGGLPVRALPRRRHDARARDALDGRGDGHRPRTSTARSSRRRRRPGNTLPATGGGRRAFVSVKDADKPAVVDVARRLVALGFEVLATARHRARSSARAASRRRSSLKVHEGRPSIVDRIKDGDVHLVVQHHRRQAGDRRQLLHPPRDADEGAAVLHDPDRRARGGGRDGGGARVAAERALDPGVPRPAQRPVDSGRRALY